MRMSGLVFLGWGNNLYGSLVRTSYNNSTRVDGDCSDGEAPEQYDIVGNIDG